MDDERFGILYRLVSQLSPTRGKRCQYSDGDILLVLLWAALRQKPICWACDRRNAPHLLRGRPRPSPSLVSRRLRSESVNMLLNLVIVCLQQPLRADPTLVDCWKIDARGFAVNRFSKDKQAKWGYCCGRKALGYKLFLLIDARDVPIAWHVEAMNGSEPIVAQQLIEHIDRPGYLLGDSLYDSNALHELTAAKQVQLLAPRKEPHQPIGRRSEARLHAIAMLETPVNTFGPSLYNSRTDIERVFSRWAASDVALDHLPSWVRTLTRVRRWINAKILIALALEK
jgi:hypothetical protein